MKKRSARKILRQYYQLTPKYSYHRADTFLSAVQTFSPSIYDSFRNTRYDVAEVLIWRRIGKFLDQANRFGIDP